MDSKIKIATIKDIPTIRELALLTWEDTYGKILTREQTEYMLEMMYSVDSLTKQFNSGHVFHIVHSDNQPMGYMSVQVVNDELILHKIYIRPDAQGKGVGNTLIDKAVFVAKEHNLSQIKLNVNRQNPAKDFYLKKGFKIIDEGDFDIGNGFFMVDFIMAKVI